MKAHTQTYKENLVKLGKEIEAKVIYTINGVQTELDGDTLGSVTPHYEGSILKSVMKQVDIVSDIDIPLNTEINVQFGLKFEDENYEYVDYGNYIVFSSEKQEDTNNYKIIAYDKMLYAMKDYEELEITYPITIRNYLIALCTKLGLEFANSNDTFTNYDKQIKLDLYKDLGYTYRDILDELAQVTASTICINEDDELEIRYINDLDNELQEVEGTSLTISDAQDTKLKDIQVEGDTTQSGTPTPTTPIPISNVSGLQEVDVVGKNLIDVNSTFITSRTHNNITRTLNDNQTITITGTATATGNAWFNSTDKDIILLKAGTYTLSSNYSNDLNLYLTGGVYCTGTFTINEDKYIRNALFRVVNGVTYNETVWIMLEKNSRATSYEPYKGNTYEINLGKNLLDLTDGTYTATDITAVVSNGEITLNGTAGANRFLQITRGEMVLENGTIYTISANNLAANDNVRLRIDTAGSLDTILSTINATKTITANDSYDYYANGITIRIASGTTLTNFKLKPMIEKGSKATSYSPYFTPIKLCKTSTTNYGGFTCKDEIFKSNNKWYIHRANKKITITDTSIIAVGTKQNTGTCNSWGLTNVDNTLPDRFGIGYATHFKTNLYGSMYGSTNVVGWNLEGRIITIRLPNDQFPTLQSVKDWVQEQKDNGTPLEFVVGLIGGNNSGTTDMSYDEEITNTELISQLDKLEKAKLNKGVTNISSTFPIKFSYATDYETIDEDYIKNTRADFGEKYGPVNSIVLSRSADTDNVYIQDEDSIEENGLCEIKIKDNQILNDNDRSDFLPGLLDQLGGIEYYINNFESIGITYLDLCDKYNVKIEDKFYNCIMFNNEVEIGDGLNEIIYTDKPEITQTDYKRASKTDKTERQTYLIIDKQQGQINSLISRIVDVSNTITGVDSITLENAHEGQLHYLSIKGSISQLFASNTTYPNDTRIIIGPTLVIDEDEYTLDIDRLRFINSTICDEFVYKDGECYIIRRVDSNNNPLAEEVIEERQSIVLNVKSNSTIYLKTFNNIILNCEYLLENVYTENFASQVEVKSEIIQTENSIEQKISAVTDSNGNITSGSILLAINNDESQATINADKISLEGKRINMTSDNIKINSTNFNVDENGNMTCNNANMNGTITSSNGNIGGWLVNGQGLTNGAVHINSDGSSTIYTVADLIIMRGYIMGTPGFELSNSMIKHYDLNGDGVVNSMDYVMLQNLIGISMN